MQVEIRVVALPDELDPDEVVQRGKEEWVKLFKQTFRFTGGEIVNEFLMSTGYLPGAHVDTCSVYKKVMKMKPKWAEK